ncbi:hypothetical protein APSETT444_002664 [Aspergillus pseudonomiae]
MVESEENPKGILSPAITNTARYTRRHTRARDVNRSARPQEIKDPSAGKRSQMRPIDSGQTDTIHRTTEGGRHDRDNGVEIPGVGIAGINARDRSQNGQEQSPPHLQPPGEPTSLSYVVEVVYSPNDGSTEPLKVHYPIPASIADRPDTNHAPRLEEPVSLQEAFIMPPRNVADQLIQAFFRKLHPAFPVFDRQRFTRLYHQGQASPLVLQTIFFLGFTVGSEELVHTAGYSERATARKTHYLRAKALYDADYENDRMNLVAVLLLFGFWWAGPEDQKDPCHWIGCAIALAQSLGMHRYNTLVVTDTLASTPQKAYDTYLVSDILIGEFSPRHAALDKYDTEMLAGRLAQWESQLPDQLRKTTPDGSLGASFWASMIHFSYQYGNCLILLFRPKAIENLSPAEAECDVRGRMAADTITRLAEDLLGAGMIKEGLVHLVPALFSALSVHTIVICRKDPIRRQLAENKSRQCLLALSELASSWPVKIWIAKAFVNLLRRLTVQGSASIINVSSSIANNRSNVALSARSNSSGLHQAHSPKQAILENSNRNELMSQASYIHGPQLRDLYPSGNLPQGADHIVYSSFWASYLDNTFDMDLLLHNSLGPTLAGPLDGLDAAEGANPLQF